MTRDQMYPVPFLWPAGPFGLVAPERVIAAGRWCSAPIRRAARRAKADGRLIDLTFGKACKWVIFLDSGHLALVAVSMPVAEIVADGYDEYVLRKHGEE